jgi:hypothetical protein
MIVMAFVALSLTKSITIFVRDRYVERGHAADVKTRRLTMIVSGFATNSGTKSTHDHGRNTDAAAIDPNPGRFSRPARPAKRPARVSIHVDSLAMST